MNSIKLAYYMWEKILYASNDSTKQNSGLDENVMAAQPGAMVRIYIKGTS